MYPILVRNLSIHVERDGVSMDKRYQVFVSSTYKDLVEERKEATQAILRCDCFPAGMELFPASSKSQWDVIKKVIDDSDVYLLILAGRYGSLGTDDGGNKLGYTEMEFDYALAQGKPILAMLHKDIDSLPARLVEESPKSRRALKAFREKASNGRVVDFWVSKEELSANILYGLQNLISDGSYHLKGWVRGS